jgi:DNA helicase IV
LSESGEVRTSSPTVDIDSELAAEQAYTDTVYAKLDAERADTAVRLSRALADQPGSSPQLRTEREVATTMYRERLAQLNGVEAGLYFGRLDNTDGSIARIGRIGLFDEENDYEPLLLDWRAPAARPFYLATAASPQGVRRRRHVRLRLRQVVGYDDEVLDLDSDEQGSDLGLAGEAALLAALNRQRGDQMRDIVAPVSAVCWWCKAVRAPVRPRSRCTVRRTCCTSTVSCCPAAVCWLSGRTRRSCTTSVRCCRHWVRPGC